MTTIDAMGKACPMPVVLAKRELDAGAAQLEVLVDNPTAVQNLTRLGESQGCAVTSSRDGDAYRVTFARAGAPAAAPERAETAPKAQPAGGWVLFVGGEGIGRGSDELGGNLMTMLFYTLAEGDNPPDAVLFMNGGVKVPTLNAQAAGHLEALRARGCDILVCGTCLNFYGLTDRLQVGRVSNMYDISARMLAAGKVISL